MSAYQAIASAVLTKPGFVSVFWFRYFSCDISMLSPSGKAGGEVVIGKVEIMALRRFQ